MNIITPIQENKQETKMNLYQCQKVFHPLIKLITQGIAYSEGLMQRTD